MCCTQASRVRAGCKATSVALSFDTSRAPLREEEFADLVRAVVGALESDESSWIEWKGTLNLRLPEGKAAVVRCIAGLANRQPDAASRFCEGRGFMIVGAEPGRVVGVREEDPADLSNWWTPYLGTDGPRWVPHWVSAQDTSVLVIEVAAPRVGDPLFVIRKATLGLNDGDVFVRRIGKTERASSADFTALVRRSSTRPVLSGVSVRLGHRATVPPVEFGPEELDAWVSAAQADAMSSLPAAETAASIEPRTATFDVTPSETSSSMSIAELTRLKQRQADGEELTDQDRAQLELAEQAVRRITELIAGVRSTLWDTDPEDRSPEQYHAEVQQYADKLRTALPRQLRASASRLLDPCVFTITNETATNLPEVRLLVHLPNDADASEPDQDGPGLPQPPRPYGPRTRATFRDGNGLNFPTPGNTLGRSTPPWPLVEIENRGSVTLRFKPVHLRPYDTVRLPPVVFLLPAVGSVVARWEATSTGADGVTTGTVSIPLAPIAVTVARALTPGKE